MGICKTRMLKWITVAALVFCILLSLPVSASAASSASSSYDVLSISASCADSSANVEITKTATGWYVKAYGYTKNYVITTSDKTTTVTITISNTATYNGAARSVSFDLTTTGANSSYTDSSQTLTSDTVSFTFTSGKGSGNFTEVYIDIANVELGPTGDSFNTVFQTSYGGSYTVDGEALTASTTLSKTDSESYTLVATPASGYELLGWMSSNGVLDMTGSISYTYTGKVDATVWPVFRKSGSAVYYVKDANPLIYYTFFDEAVAAAGTSGTIVLYQSGGLYGTNGSTFTLAGQTLLIPYNAIDLSIATTTYTDDSGGLASTWQYANVAFTSDQYDDGNASNSSVKGVMEPDTSVYMTLTIPSGTTLNVNSGSKMVIGGTIVSGTTMTGGVCGATAGAHSNVVVNGTLNVNSGGVLSACGYVLGEGSVNIVGGSAYQPLTLMDYHDGHHTANSTKNANFPAYRYIMQNIRPELTISSGGKMYGYVDIYTQETNAVITTIKARHNVACQMIIGTASDSQCLVKLTDGATVNATYDATDYVTITSGAAGSAYYSKAGKTHLTINGGATMGYLSISVNVPIIGSQTSNSYETDFPLPYHYDITLENGTYTIPYTLVLYPGASMTVKNGAELVVDGKFVVLDGLRDYTGRATSVTIGSWYEYHYPSTANFKNNHSKGTYNGTANLTVDGTLTVSSNASFGGYVQTNGTGKVVMKGTPSATAGVGNVATYGTPVNEYVGRTDHTLSAWLWEADGELICMTTGATYSGVDAGTHTIASYDYIVYTNPGDTSTYTTVNDEALNAVITGSWKHDCTSYTSVVTAPTCTEGGYTTHTCTVCKYSYTDSETAATGHSYTEAVTAPTCTAKGYTTHTCSCGDSYVDSYVDAKGHTEVVDAAVAATCTETGLTEGKHCSVCGTVTVAQTEVPALGHKDDNTDHICDRGCGVYQGTHADSATDKDHVCDYGCGATLEDCSDVTTDQDHNCDVCGKENVTVHTYGEWYTVTAATCTVDGQERRDCNCGAYETNTLPATGHQNTTTTTVAATCTVDGSVTVTCDDCGTTVSTETVAASGHSHTSVVTEPTCYAQGFTTHTCSVCGDSYVDAYTAMIDHTPAAAVQENYKDSTCSAEGSYDEVVYCSVEACKHEISRTPKTVEKKDHTPAEAVVENEVDATYNEKGSYDSVVYCGACGAELSRETIEIPMLPGVAEVNGTKYGTLAEAVEAAESGATVTLLTDASGAGVVINKSITIDFGGHTYTFTEGVGSTGTESNGFQILRGNTVVLKNGTLNVAETSKDKFYMLIQNYANLTVEDMTLDGTNLDKWSGIDGDSYTLSNNSGTVNITGATNIKANDEGDKAFAFDVCKYGSYAAPVVNVNTTGTITGKIEVSESIATNLNISGGTFTVEIDEAWCAEGFGPTDNGDGTYGVHVHSYKAEVTEPTCTEQGYTTHTCSECGDAYKDTYVAAKEHAYELTDSKDATCTEAGYKTYTCENDASHTYTDTEAALGHDEVSHEAQAPTCTEIGWDAYVTCSRCDYTTYVEKPATGHAEVAGSHNCGNCGAALSQCGISTPAYGEGNLVIDIHDLEALGASSFIQNMTVETLLARVDYAITVAENVSDGGILDRIAATEEFQKFLSDLLQTNVDELTDANVKHNAMVLYAAHGIVNMTEAEISELFSTNSADTIRYNFSSDATGKELAKGLAQSALVYGMYTGYAYYEGNDELIAKLDSADIILDAFEDEGFMSYVNGDQGQKDLEGFLGAMNMIEDSGASVKAVEKLLEKGFTDAELTTVISKAIEDSNHKCAVCGDTQSECRWNDGEVTTEPGCETTGVKTFTCLVCGATKTETVEARGHTEVIDAAVAATCTTAGKTEGSHCSVCNEVLVAQTEVPATGHTEVIDAAVDPTCTATGLTEGKHCSVCSEVLVAQTEVAALGHDYDDGVVTTDPTCTENGVKTYTCKNDASHTHTEAVEATGHTEGEAVKENEVAGSYESVVYCSVCNTELSRETVTTGPAVDSSLIFYSKELSLGADIRAVFSVKQTVTSPYDNIYLVIDHNGEKITVESYLIYGENTKYYYFAYTLAAKQMADELSITIYGVKEDDTVCISNSVVWSIKQGAIDKMNGWYDGTEDDMNKCILLANMLNYGAEAQKVFSYNTENLATDGLEEKYLALIKTETPEMSTISKTADTGMSATLYGYDLNLAEKVEILPIYKMSDANFAKEDYHAVIEQTHTNTDGTTSVETHTVNGADCIQYGKYLYVYFRELASNELRDLLTITLYKGDEVVAVVQDFSVESVCSNKLTAYPDLIPALMNYGDCAKVVFG